jgi:hypothetical protein
MFWAPWTAAALGGVVVSFPINHGSSGSFSFVAVFLQLSKMIAVPTSSARPFAGSIVAGPVGRRISITIVTVGWGQSIVPIERQVRLKQGQSFSGADSIDSVQLVGGQSHYQGTHPPQGYNDRFDSLVVLLDDFVDCLDVGNVGLGTFHDLFAD